MRRISYFILLIPFIFLMTGCPDDNPTSPKPDVTIEEKVVEQKTTTIGTSGGTISLSDGTEVIIPSGSVSSETKVIVSKIENDNYFSGSNRVSIDISSDKSITGMTVKIKVKSGLSKEQVGVFRYNPEDSKTQSFVEGDVPEFNYDSQTGIITATVNAGSSKSKKEQVNGSLLFPRWVAEYDENIEGEVESRIIEMPFYEQPGSSCWATCATMLSKAYTPYTDRKSEAEVYNYLKYMQLGRDDGIYSFQFLRTLPKAFHLYSGGAGVEATGFFRLSALREKIIKELDEQHPVIVNLDYPGVGQHAILVIGYIKKTSGSGKVTYDLVIHNPQGTGSETMYTIHDFDWVFSKKSMTTAVQILYPTVGVHPDRTLLTLGMPMSSLVGDISFKVPTRGGSSYSIRFSENISNSRGYSWRYGTGNEILAVPDTATEFNIKLPIWNADRSSSSKFAILMLNIYREGKKVYEFSENLTIPEGLSAYWFDKTIPLNDIRQNFDSSEYYFKFELWDGGTYADGFDFYVNIDKGLHPLNGRWLFTYSDVNNNCDDQDSMDQSIYYIKTTKTILILYTEEHGEEDGWPFNFSYNKDEFSFSTEFNIFGYDCSLSYKGRMEGDDKFVANMEAHGWNISKDENGNEVAIPCTTLAKVTGTRLK